MRGLRRGRKGEQPMQSGLLPSTSVQAMTARCGRRSRPNDRCTPLLRIRLPDCSVRRPPDRGALDLTDPGHAPVVSRRCDSSLHHEERPRIPGERRDHRWPTTAPAHRADGKHRPGAAWLSPAAECHDPPLAGQSSPGEL